MSHHCTNLTRFSEDEVISLLGLIERKRLPFISSRAVVSVDARASSPRPPGSGTRRVPTLLEHDLRQHAPLGGRQAREVEAFVAHPA